ncbi:MAG: L,D-transpeptidase, partial [Pseudomonadota bacterium]
RIHGTNQPWTIGQAMSSGCIRLANSPRLVSTVNPIDRGTDVK